MVHRRTILAALAASPLTALLGGAAPRQAWAAPTLGEPVPFSPDLVRRRARELAGAEFRPPEANLPKELKELNYDQYRDIRFQPEQAVWRGEGGSFELQPLHLGFYFDAPVKINVVEDNYARRLRYAPEYFSFGSLVPQLPPLDDIGYSGFRLHAPLNRPEYLDEFAVFQGASYFRAVGRGQGYGLSARGLALDTAAPKGEEFPIFRAFWIERPRLSASAVVVHALLDSRSVTGAYHFTIRPGEQTEMEVDLVLYPRTNLANAGIAPMTSMYLFGAADRAEVDDFRPSVHDSDGLAIWNGRDERLWRPLTNPSQLQVSQFLDEGPRAFGLMQRQRRFEAYQDLEARYERRPSLWVEPVGNWGPGAVHLTEIPSREEIHDNIVAFWQPAKPIPAGGEVALSYRMFWCWAPDPAPETAIVTATRVGAGRSKSGRRYVIDFVGERLKQLASDQLAAAKINASAGVIKFPVVQVNPETGGQRVSFELDPSDAKVAELRCYLELDGQRISEVWTSRWSS